MADMNIGTAYVRIEPTAKGIAGKIEKEMSGIGASGGASFGKGFGSVLGGVGKAAVGAIAAASAAAVGVVKSATESYAEFEQLEGGTKLLFGDAFDTVMKNLVERGVIKPGRLFIAETTFRIAAGDLPDWDLCRDREYGKTRLLIWKRHA
jgi:hypothetical protein